MNVSMVSPGSGEVRWPLLSFTLGRGLWDSGYHQGVDLLTSCGQPIYATAAGVVTVVAGELRRLRRRPFDRPRDRRRSRSTASTVT